MKRIIISLAGFGMVAAVALTLATSSSSGKEGVYVGSQAPAFTLKDFNDGEHSLKGVLDDEKTQLAVVEFIATRCPVSKDYDSRMVALYNDYHRKGVRFIGINSNCAPMEDLAEIQEHAERNKIPFPVVKDYDNVVADLYRAMVTPNMYVVDKKGTIRYIGRIDDSQRESKVKSHDLRNALDELLAGKKVSVSKTKAFGCSIKRVKKS